MHMIIRAKQNNKNKTIKTCMHLLLTECLCWWYPEGGNMALSTAGDDIVPQHSSGHNRVILFSPPGASGVSTNNSVIFQEQNGMSWGTCFGALWVATISVLRISASWTWGKVPRPGVEVRRQARRKPLSTIHYWNSIWRYKLLDFKELC